MHIVVTGSTGLIGSALVARLADDGSRITRLVRSAATAGGSDVVWDPAEGRLEVERLSGIDAAVHLAGESIAAGRWTDEKKRRIRDSRVQGTHLLATALAELDPPPQVLVCASAVGYYGDRGDELLDEQSPPGTNFLAEVCQAWEAAAEPAVERGIRVVPLRFGMVLSPAGGALQKMLTPFRLGLGGRVGSGRQFYAWIALDDAVGAIRHALATRSLKGPVNAVTPNPVTNLEFTKTLGRVLRRPTVFPMPAFTARAAFGQMADELLLASTRVQPKRLVESGYEFQYPELEGALRHLLRE